MTNPRCHKVGATDGKRTVLAFALVGRKTVLQSRRSTLY